MTTVLAQTPAVLPPVVALAFEAAIAAAEAFRGATAPNPPVGCVLLDAGGGVLAIGAHRRAGDNHAEADALDLCRRAGTLEAIRTVVVTLEPCNHSGRTPPCAGAILATPAQTVWIGAIDPNPDVSGGGAARLVKAGVLVNTLVADGPDPAARALAISCQALIAPFAKRVLTGRPWVTVKQAFDRDGSMIPPPGTKTFTSAPALLLAHRLRRRADAILTGSGTVLADDPHFTVRRIADHPGKRRHLAILDRRRRVPLSYIEAAEARGFAVRIEEALEPALDRLGREGILEILAEAGPAVTESLLDAGLWDEHVVIRKGTGIDDDRATVRDRRDGSLQDIIL